MSNKQVLQDDVTQALLIADNYNDNFEPVTNNIPFALLPVINRPLIDYTLEFLSLTGIEETFVICSNHAEEIKNYINGAIAKKTLWSQTMDVKIIVLQNCRSLGDCLRDIYAKGIIQGNFVLLEPGVIANVRLLPLFKTHADIVKKDKSAAMTLIYQEVGVKHFARCPSEELVILANASNQILFLKRLGLSQDRKINFPLNFMLENAKSSMHHNLKDTHMAICSPSVLSLFSDNFDYQTRDDFIRSVLMVDDVMDATIYYHILKGTQHGGAITNWRMYSAISRELLGLWFHPLVPTYTRLPGCWFAGVASVHAGNLKYDKSAKMESSVFGSNVTVGAGAVISRSFIFDNVVIEPNAQISYCVISSGAIIKSNSKITSSIIGNDVVIESEIELKDVFIQSTATKDLENSEKISDNAYRLEKNNDEEDEFQRKLSTKLSHIEIDDLSETSDDDDDELDSDSENEDGPCADSPEQDDGKMFYTEVFDSLARGFEDKLPCDNLILEINSSRYAYNITLKEVTYFVVKAILSLPCQESTGQQYLPALVRSLAYFSPILKNYLSNESTMGECLHAIQDLVTELPDLQKSITKILNWFYDKEYLTEEAILTWYDVLDESSELRKSITPFIEWLKDAEEESSEESSEGEN